MMTFIAVFWLLVAVIAIIGAMRGWAKELINTFTVVLALFLYNLLINQTELVRSFFDNLMTSDPIGGQRTAFLVISGLFMLIVFFGYLGPVVARATGGKMSVKARETLQDSLLGLILGAANGYLIIGTLWFFLTITNYPFPEGVMVRPAAGTPSDSFVQYLPLVYLIPYLNFLLAAAFLMLIILFV